MNIDKITLTGLDTLVDLERVVELSNIYPVEWGILFSTAKEGQRRYPYMWVVDRIIRTDVPLSAHFCGVWAKEVLEKQNFDLIKTLNNNFKRVQLNYNFSHNQNWSLTHLSLFAHENPNRRIILQYNKSNSTVLDIFKDGFPPNIDLLYDASGGRGTEITNIHHPFKNYTGYAGGINENNIAATCAKITQVDNPSNVWIDMESGIRTNNIFDIEKCNKVLSIASKLINMPVMGINTTA